jgi:hypothetical protein
MTKYFVWIEALNLIAVLGVQFFLCLAARGREWQSGSKVSMFLRFQGFKEKALWRSYFETLQP